jgi:hypothetical protein
MEEMAMTTYKGELAMTKYSDKLETIRSMEILLSKMGHKNSATTKYMEEMATIPFTVITVTISSLEMQAWICSMVMPVKTLSTEEMVQT